MSIGGLYDKHMSPVSCWTYALGGVYHGFRKDNVVKEALVSDAFKPLGKTVGGHDCSTDVLDVDVTIVESVFDVLEIIVAPVSSSQAPAGARVP